MCPPFTALRSVQILIETDRMAIQMGAQHVYWEESGAYTGEVSAAMLAKMGTRYVICGHSERRQLFGETDAMVNRRAKTVIAYAMTPIVCVGETLEQREGTETESVVVTQLKASLTGIDAGLSAAWPWRTSPFGRLARAGTPAPTTPHPFASSSGKPSSSWRVRRQEFGSDPLRWLGERRQHQRLHGQTSHRRCVTTSTFRSSWLFRSGRQVLVKRCVWARKCFMR